MLPGMAPFSTVSLLLSLAGFLGGAVIWHVLASHSGVWSRMQFESSNVKRLLVRQMSIAVIVTMLLALLAGVFGGIISTVLRWLSAFGGIVFWGYLGALALTALRGSRVQRQE